MEKLEQYKLNNIEFFANQVVEGFITGKHKSPYHGFSVEFAEHRLYNSGESTKNIDWKLYARTEKLFVKRFEEETNLRCQIVLDTSSSMFYPNFNNPSLEKPNKILFSVYASAVLINILKRQRDAIGLSVCKGYIMSNEAESIFGSCTTKEQIITESVDSTNVANCGLISLA